MSQQPAKLRRPTAAEDARIQRGIAAVPENPELTAAEFEMHPARETVQAVVAANCRMRGPQKKPTNLQIGLRLDRDLLQRLRDSGPGWQVRANSILRQSLLDSGKG